MSYSSRFWLYAPLAMFLVLAGGAMAYWWMVAGALDKKLDGLNGHAALPGITISYAAKTISGFPFNIDIVFTGFKIAGAGAHGPFAWSTEKFALHRLTYGRAQDIYEAAGRQALSWTDGAGHSRHIDFLPGALRASAITDDKGLARFDLDIADASGQDGGEAFAVVRAQFHMRRDPARDGLDVMVGMDDAKQGEVHIRSLSDYRTLIPGKPFAALLAGHQSWPGAAAAWRETGGTAQQGKRQVTPAAHDSAADPILASLY